MTELRIGKRGYCSTCGGDAGNNWFDRSLCPCADVMHTRCRDCGAALDGCSFAEHVHGWGAWRSGVVYATREHVTPGGQPWRRCACGATELWNEAHRKAAA